MREDEVVTLSYKLDTLKTHFENYHYRVFFIFNLLIFILDDQSKITPFYIIIVYFKAFLFLFQICRISTQQQHAIFFYFLHFRHLQIRSE